MISPTRAGPSRSMTTGGIHPEDRRTYKVPKNAGMVPPGFAAMQEIPKLRSLLDDAEDPEEQGLIRVEIAQKDTVPPLKMERNPQR